MSLTSISGYPWTGNSVSTEILSVGTSILSILFQDSYISETYAARKVLTLWGMQNDPNNCAAFLIVGFMLAIYSILYEKRRILLNLIVALVNIYAIMLTASRAGLVAVVVIIIFMVVIPTNTENIGIVGVIKRLIIMLVVVMLCYCIIQHYLPQAGFERLFSFNDYVGGSGRSDRWSQALILFEERPIWGWGWGGYIVSLYREEVGIHNTFITSLCDGGAIGTLLLILPMGIVCFNAIKNKNAIVFLLLICGVLPAFFIDAINKRFFWNAIIFSIMLNEYNKSNGNKIGVWLSTSKDAA